MRPWKFVRVAVYWSWTAFCACIAVTAVVFTYRHINGVGIVFWSLVLFLAWYVPVMACRALARMCAAAWFRCFRANPEDEARPSRHEAAKAAIKSVVESAAGAVAEAAVKSAMS